MSPSARRQGAVGAHALQENEIGTDGPRERIHRRLDRRGRVGLRIEEDLVVLTERRAGARHERDEAAPFDKERPDQDRLVAVPDDDRRQPIGVAWSKVSGPGAEHFRCLEQGRAVLPCGKAPPVRFESRIGVRPAQDDRQGSGVQVRPASRPGGGR